MVGYSKEWTRGRCGGGLVVSMVSRFKVSIFVVSGVIVRSGLVVVESSLVESQQVVES